MGKNAVVLQWAAYSPDDTYCYIIGHYDASRDEPTYSLIEVINPALGVSISYPAGEKCTKSEGKLLRSATIDVYCANTEKVILSAQEPSECNYHLQMKSYYGCPKVRILCDRRL